MIREFCDRCLVEITDKRDQRWVSLQESVTKARRWTLCKACFQRVRESLK